MADNSKVVLRWEIDNSAGLQESSVTNEGGFEWKVAFVPSEKTVNADFSIVCDLPRRVDWSCKADVKLLIIHPDNSHSRKMTSKFSGGRPFASFDNFVHIAGLFNNPALGYVNNGKVTFEVRIHILRSERGRPTVDPIAEAKFSVPNRRSDVVLKIGEKKVHACKEFLAYHSPVFETLFFGDFAENGKEAVEMKDVDYAEFLDLLNYLSFGAGDITDHTVLHLLKLADLYQIETVLEQSKAYLTQSKGFDVVKKLLIADQYSQYSLRDHCLNTFTSAEELIGKVKSSPEYERFSGDMKIKICDRIMNF